MFGRKKDKAKAKPSPKASPSPNANAYNREEGWADISAPDGTVWRWNDPPGTIFDALDQGSPPPIMFPPPFDPAYPAAEPEPSAAPEKKK